MLVFLPFLKSNEPVSWLVVSGGHYIHCAPTPLALPCRANPDMVYINTTLSSHHSQFILHIEPLKMDLTEGSKMSAKHNLMPGKYPKEHTQDSEYGENLKSRAHFICQ
jgi:hypothetical protein